jgi:hypothetical protein
MLACVSARLSPRSLVGFGWRRGLRLCGRLEPRQRRTQRIQARRMRKSVVLHGDAKLPELRHVLANCPKAKAFSYDQCKVLTAKTVTGARKAP